MSILRVALVTGGNRGIGRACSLALADAGYHTVIACRDHAAGMETVELIRQINGSAGLMELDVSDSAKVQEQISGLIEEMGLDVLVNNAGITRDNLVMRMEDDEWERVLSTNLTGPFRICRAVITHMRKSKGNKSIINISSIVAQGHAGQANYAASKAGLEAFTKSLAQETGGRVRVNAVAPGWIDTDMTANVAPAMREAALARIALKRAGTPEDVAKVVAFLASDAASYINGAVIPVDGGMV